MFEIESDQIRSSQEVIDIVKKLHEDGDFWKEFIRAVEAENPHICALIKFKERQLRADFEILISAIIGKIREIECKIHTKPSDDEIH